ncbi:MAG: 1-hydroxycarotenoid 3,4-desaturase CrtD [Paracoccaceae bacterium]
MTATGQSIVVIGAGVGGLCAAIRLALAGMNVTLVEAQLTPGGKMRSIPSEAGPIDAGPTVLTLRSVFDELFMAAGERLEDHVTLIPHSVLARHWWRDGSRLDLHASAEASAAAIAAFAGLNAEAEFIRFHRKTAQLYMAFDGPMLQAPRPSLTRIIANTLRAPKIWTALHPSQSLSSYLDRSFTDARLRQLFGRYATYVGGTPDLSPAVLALIWQAEAQGVWSPLGGMTQLARALADLAERAGVKLRYGISAQKILQTAGRASAVVLSDGSTFKCDAVVFNGDPAALLAGLLGNGPQQALSSRAAHPRSLSAWVWSFAAKPSEIDLQHHNVFFGSDPALEFSPISNGRMPEEATLYVCAQDRGMPGGSQAGAERFEIIMNAPVRSTRSPQETSQCRSMTFPQLARFGLTFDPQPRDQALMTPHGFSVMFPGSEGSLYGRSPHGKMASFHRSGARTRMPGLYLSGGGARPGAGVPMAALSGKHAAEAILSDLTSASQLPLMAMRGGMSMVSRLTGQKLSR